MLVWANIDGKKDKVVIGICYVSPTNNDDRNNMSTMY